MIFSVVFAISALEVDREELSTVKLGSVEFLNYEGPHLKIETRAEIRGIGSMLGEEIVRGQKRASYYGKYTVLHVFDPSEPEKLSADIFIIEPGASVDHIKNVRLMVSGYLEAAYGYSEADAAILAEFVSYYNAVFRRNLAYITEKYTQAVVRSLDAEKIGISTRYTEWPGNTQLIIPITEEAKGNGSLSSLDSGELTHEKVIEDLRKGEDKGIEPRKDITEFKEKALEEEQGRIKEEKKAITAEEKRIEEEKKAAAEETKAVEKEVQSLQEKEKASGKTAETEKERTELERKKEELAKKDTELAQAEEAVKGKEAEVVAKEKKAAETEEQIKQEREQIAKDEKELIETEKQKESFEKAQKETVSTLPQVKEEPLFLYLFVHESGGEYLGTFALVDKAKRRVMTRSSLNTVRGRQYEIFDGKIAAIAGTSGGNRAVRLVLLDPKSLDILEQGSDDIFKDSVLRRDGNELFAVVQKNEVYYLGKFDTGLKLKATSQISVAPYTAIAIENGEVYAQKPDGSVDVFSSADLSELK